MNSATYLYQKLFEHNVTLSVWKLLICTYIFYPDNAPKLSSKSTKEWLRKNKWRLMEWPSKSLYFNTVEMPWVILNSQYIERSPSTIFQLKEFCMEEWQQWSLSRPIEKVSAQLNSTDSKIKSHTLVMKWLHIHIGNNSLPLKPSSI